MNVSSRLPNLIIAGVTKAGTTSLFTYLKMHPQICASKVKETCYFLPIRYGMEMQPIQDYLQCFNECGNANYVIEATPGYFYGGKKVATAIKRVTGHIYVLIALREPVSRMFSFYNYLKSRMLLPKEHDFSTYVEQCRSDSSPRFDSENYDLFWGMDGGFYDHYLDDWVEVFGDHLKVVFFDDIVAHPQRTLEEICDWLGIDSRLYHSLTLETENRSVNYRNGLLHKLAILLNDKVERFWRRFPKLKSRLRKMYQAVNGREFEETINPAIRNDLYNLFLPHNKNLAHQLAEMGYKDLPPWLKIDDTL